MGFQDRRYDERRPYDSRGWGGSFWRRVVGEGDNFFMWAVKIFRVAGISVRLHVLFILYIVGMLINAGRNDQFDLKYTAISIACLFTIVLLHEFGHCIACRKVGGEADDIVLWPLGGLAMCRPPNDWKSHLITTLGGPAVNVILLPVLGGAVYLLTREWGAVVFNPLDIGAPFKLGYLRDDLARWVYLAHVMNFKLLAFNVLLPMYPMDGGRILQELLWWRLGRERSLDIAANLGFFLAIAVGAYAMLGGYNQLFGVALFAGISCWQAKMSRRFLAQSGEGGAGGDGPEFATAYIQPTAPPARDQAKYKEALKHQQKEQADEVEVDRILAKISAEGMASLSRSERKVLERHTERRRGGRT